MAVTSTKNIARAVYASLKGKSGTELDQATKKATEFLIKKNLLGKSSLILEYIEKMADEEGKVVRARVISPEPLPANIMEELRGSLKRRYEASEIILEEKEDKTLIGGMRIEAKDEVIDLSLKNKVNQLRSYLLQN